MTDERITAPVGGQPVFKPVCAHCGGDRIVRDASARWDTLSGEWLLADMQDCYFCDGCNADGDDLATWSHRPTHDETTAGQPEQ